MRPALPLVLLLPLLLLASPAAPDLLALDLDVSSSVRVAAMPLRFSREWLAASRAALLSWPPRMHLVIGNEACDCDSALAALAYAFRLAARQRRWPSGAALPPVVIPVVSCLRRDWPLRREAAFLLSRCLAPVPPAATPPLPPEEADVLVFLDDIEALLEEPVPPVTPQVVTVTLVDHNELKGPLLARLGAGAVTEIVDHHFDSGRHAHVTGDLRRIAFDSATMTGGGSTCTLVAQSLLDDTAEEAAANGPLDAGLAEMLRSVILLDTAGLDQAAGKATPLDRDIVRRLREVVIAAGQDEAAARALDRELEPRFVFERLMALKQDPAFWRALSVEQALGFDFKSFEVSAGAGAEAAVFFFGTSSVMASLQDFLSGWAAPESSAPAPATAFAPAPARLAAMAEFVAARSLAFTLVLAVSGAAGGGLRRGLALVAATGSARGAALVDEAARLLQLNAPELLLEELPAAAAQGAAAAAGEKPHARFFSQGNASASRKQVVPLIMRALHERTL